MKQYVTARQIGNAVVVTLPKVVRDVVKVTAGQRVLIATTSKGQITLTPEPKEKKA